MGKDDGKKPPGKDKKRPFRVVKTGETVLAKPSIEQVKQIYMASANLEWIPFAKSMGWDPNSTREQYPVAEWIYQKKQALAREQSEQISELIFDHRSRWHRDVLKTLRDYPEANDAVLGVLKTRINDMIQIINEDENEKVLAAQRGEKYDPRFRKVKTSELLALSAAVKTITESKQRSLLIHDWSVKVAEQFTDPKQFEAEENKMKDVGWKIEVIGGENITSKEMQELMAKYYDKPNQLHSPEEIVPPPPEMPPEEEF